MVGKAEQTASPPPAVASCAKPGSSPHHPHHTHSKGKTRKPYEEIGAIFNGNEVKIRVPKTTFKPPKLTPSQIKMQQQCTCEEVESVCSSDCGMESEDDGGPENRLNFQKNRLRSLRDLSGLRSSFESTYERVNPTELRGKFGAFQVPDDICDSLTRRTPLNSEVTYTCKEAHDRLCNVCNVTPKDAPKGVRAHKVLHPDKDVFLLKIGKQTDEPNRTGNIEVELITPRTPAKPKPATHSCKEIQCEEYDIPCCIPCRTCRPAGPKRRRIRRPKLSCP